MGDDTISCRRFSLPMRTGLLLKLEKPSEKQDRKRDTLIEGGIASVVVIAGSGVKDEG